MTPALQPSWQAAWVTLTSLPPSAGNAGAGVPGACGDGRPGPAQAGGRGGTDPGPGSCRRGGSTGPHRCRMAGRGRCGARPWPVRCPAVAGAVPGGIEPGDQLVVAGGRPELFNELDGGG